MNFVCVALLLVFYVCVHACDQKCDPFCENLPIVSRTPDSFGKESGNFSRVSVCQCRNVDTTI